MKKHKRRLDELMTLEWNECTLGEKFHVVSQAWRKTKKDFSDFKREQECKREIERRRQCLQYPDVVRLEGDKVHILGHTGGIKRGIEGDIYTDLRSRDVYLAHVVCNSLTGKVISENYFNGKNDKDILLAIGFSVIGIGIPSLINELRPSVLKDGRETTKYIEDVENFQQANLMDLRKKVKDIKLYQGGFSEVSERLRRKLEIVDTGKPETYISAENNFDLRVKAYGLGANAVIHCKSGSSVGTPVRYKEQEK